MEEMDLDLAVTMGINNPPTHNNGGLSVMHIFSAFERTNSLFLLITSYRILTGILIAQKFTCLI